MAKLDKYRNRNIKEVLEEIAHFDDIVLVSDDAIELTKKQLINILSSVSQGTPPDLAFRAEGLHQLFKELSSLYKVFKGNIEVQECHIYQLIERVWFKSLAQVTTNIYKQAIQDEGKNAIAAAKLLLEYHAKMEETMHKYDVIRNIK